jgi:hypothetical protein
MKIVLFNDIGSDSLLYVDGRLSLNNVHMEAKKHYDKMVKFKGSFSNEYGIGKSIKSINEKQFKIAI